MNCPLHRKILDRNLEFENIPSHHDQCPSYLLATVLLKVLIQSLRIIGVSEHNIFNSLRSSQSLKKMNEIY